MKINKHKYFSEIYLLTEKVDAEQWQKLYVAVLQYCGVFTKFDLIFSCHDNLVRYFIGSDKDLSSLSNNIDGILLIPVDSEIVKSPVSTGRKRFLQLVTGGNFLDLKEKYLVKNSIDLVYAVANIRSINLEKAIVKINFHFKNSAGGYIYAKKSTTFFPKNLFAVDFASNAKYLKKTTPKYLDIEKSLHLLTSANIEAMFEVDTFPYFSQPYYLNIASYDFDKHSFIIGATGSGKSKLISLFVDRLYKTPLRENVRIVIIDPHASLHSDVEHLESTKVINFNSESAELFSGARTDLTAATELTAALFASLLGDQFNARLDRVLRFSLFVLFTAQNMSLDNLKRFLTDIDLRNQLLGHVTGYVPQNIIQFFGADFNEIKTKYYNDAIMPVISLVDEMQLQPALTKSNEDSMSLAKIINDHFLTVFSLNKVSMGERTVKTVAGLLIQQIFLLAQARVFGYKIILIIDEVSIVQNPTLASILAEARKFNLTVILTQQYFGQIEKNLQDAIFANVYNYYVFKVSEEDARALEGNLNIELPKSQTEEAKEKGMKELDVKVKIMSELNPRECILRLSSNGQINPAIKARTVDAPKPATTSHEETVLNKVEKVELPTKFVESFDIARSITPELGNKNRLDHPYDFTAQEGNTEGGKRFNISDLLAKHSSSRANLRKRRK